MNTPIFHSALAGSLGQFVQYKRALNRKYHTEAGALRLLDHYWCERSIVSWEAIDGTVIEDFLKSRPRTRPRSYNHLVGVLRRFFAWAVLQRLATQNPVTVRPRRDTGQRIPYLFDLSDAKRLLQLARTLPDNPRAPRRALVYETVFALLYGLGLRVGEVGRLKLKDVDLAQATLFIRETKFCKSRIVPMGPRLTERLRCYIERRYGKAPDPELPLFTFAPPRSIGRNTITQTFHKLIPKLELRIPAGVLPPRLHDLRRSFAVRTLLRWYREGTDPNARLMHLATFLGHVDPVSTAVYLPITEELLREADQRFRSLVPKGGAQ